MHFLRMRRHVIIITKAAETVSRAGNKCVFIRKWLR